MPDLDMDSLAESGVDGSELAQAGLGPDSEILGTTDDADLRGYEDTTEDELLRPYEDEQYGQDYPDEVERAPARSTKGQTAEPIEEQQGYPSPQQYEQEIERLDAVNSDLQQQLNTYAGVYNMFSKVMPNIKAHGVTLERYVADLLWFDKLIGENPVDAILFLKERTPGLRWQHVQDAIPGFRQRMYERSLSTQMERKMEAMQTQQYTQQADAQVQADADYISKFFNQRSNNGLARYPGWQRLIPIMKALASPPYNIENLDTLYRRASKAYNDSARYDQGRTARGNFAIKRRGANTKRRSPEDISRGEYEQAEERIIASAINSINSQRGVQR
jgi:hypothetical protein